MQAHEIIEVLSTGVGLSVQDSGRPGWRRYGVPPGGVMDRYSAQWANRLLGNRESAPVLEVLMQGARLRFLKSTWVAVAGASLGCAIEPWSARAVRAGEVLDFSGGSSGLWAYLAVPGGFQAAHWFGSASVDTRNGLGKALGLGTVLSSMQAEPNLSTQAVARRVVIAEACRDYAVTPVFELLRGPQYDLFDIASQQQLVERTWTVSPRSDRTGFRLQGPALRVPESIRSEPVLPGSFQIPGNGQPIITLNDGPTVGGYAKLAVLQEADLDWLAQCRPGTQLQFRWAD